MTLQARNTHHEEQPALSFQLFWEAMEDIAQNTTLMSGYLLA